MGTEVEHASTDIQTTVTMPSSTTSTGVPKTSIFAKKSGFVIPKNKLSGSLVPRFRSSKKGDADSMNEESTKQVQRKTKWGLDLTLDTTVRKGRALAYQTRINQISQQMNPGERELEESEDMLSTSGFPYGKASDHQLSKEELDLLELERREIIGEILKLNPTYKAPADYKPLLKEAKVPIPIKEYPGYNFIGLVFGPASDTLKRLEKETGAKIQVYGTKMDAGGKVEVTPTDGKEIDNSYEDLYIHASADTFEKIDAAVALIELLVTPVSVNPVSSSTTTTTVSDDNVNNAHLSQSMPSSITEPTLTNQAAPHPYPRPLPPLQGQFPQHPQPWYRTDLSHTPANSSTPLFSSTVQISSSPFHPTNMPSLFGPQPIRGGGFTPVLQNPSQPSYMQHASPLAQTGGPRNTHMPVFQSTPTLTRPPHNVRPVISSSPQSAPLPSSNESNRWLQSPVSSSTSQAQTNIMPMTSQHMVASRPPLLTTPNNMISPLSGPSGPLASPQFRAASESTPPTIQPSPVGPVQRAMRAPGPNAMPGPASLPFQVQSSGIPHSFSGSSQNFDPMRPISASTLRPQQPSSNDFTFQPHRPPPSAASQGWQASQPPAHHNVRHPAQPGQASLPPQQSPFLRPMAPNSNLPPGQSFPRPQVSHQQVNQHFGGNPTVPLVPPRHPILPGHHNTAGVPHMQQRNNFIPPHPMNNNSSGSPFPPRPGNQMHMQENHFHGAMHPQRFPGPPHQNFGNHPGRPFSRSSGVQQVYDPFAPTSVPFNPQMGGGNASRVHSENDPEYEDLMASVGVK